MTENIKKNLYLCLGYFGILLGVIGLFLPLMPTTCFLILAVWAFSKSNPEMSEKILQHPRFGPIIKNWIAHKTITKNIKNKISISIIIAFSISLFIFKTSILISSILIFVMLSLLMYINTRAENTNQDALVNGLVADEVSSAN